MGRSSSLSNYASIDIGSHTIRMIIARLLPENEILPVRIERRTTRLAKDFGGAEILRDVQMKESIAALAEYAKLLETHQVSAVACGATGVARRARNRKAFLGRIRQLTGLEASVLSESDEAFISGRGILSVLPNPTGMILSFDLGGGSTEFLLMDSSQPAPIWSTSVFAGAATITERYLKDDPPPPSQVALAVDHICQVFKGPLSQVEEIARSSKPHSAPVRIVGTAGTVTTLAAMRLGMTHYEPFRVNGLDLSGSWLKDTIDTLARSTLAARRTIPGLETGREDIILGGALIVGEILRGTRQDRLTVTDGGLLEGLLLDLIEKERGLPQPLVSSLTWRLQKE